MSELAQAEPLRYVYWLQLRCMLCGRRIGELQSETERPRRRTFVPASMRCGHCGGLPVFDGEFRRQIGEEIQIADVDRARPGRPPKRLVQLRRAEATRLHELGVELTRWQRKHFGCAA